ncbi:unnamed protein product [Lymnaea stagnalis]|uniref:Amine oxidase n=1 Tax=Lymnaea stagnalis TaxID=6523 RepID=A0AAV2H4A1_LYMST
MAGISTSALFLQTSAHSPDEILKENQKLQKKIKRTCLLLSVISFVALALLGAVIGILVYDSHTVGTPALKECGILGALDKDNVDYLDEPVEPGPFHDLTSNEIRDVRRFLKQMLNLGKPEAAKLSDPLIYMMDLAAPNKSDALAYLDFGAAPPPRYATVTIFRGDMTPPVVEERLCGPLPNISSCRVVATMPFASRPFGYGEFYRFYATVIQEAQRLFGNILQESYGLNMSDACKSHCGSFAVFPIASNMNGISDRRKVWLMLTYDIAFYTLYPVDFGLLCDVDGVNENLFSIESIWYSGIMYSKPNDLLEAYSNGSANKTRIPYPSEKQTKFSDFKRRGPPKPAKRRRPPQLFEPDGKRFTVRHRKVEYLDMWSFYYRMSTIRGPAVYDIRFLGERIAYEISLSELGVFYSGYSPMLREAFYVDTAFLSGSGSRALVPGADCPTTAILLPFVVSAIDKEESAVFPRSICIFEQSFGTPLRRHLTPKGSGSFYGGLMDSALIVRSINTVDNYDYVVDFIFHQNGVLGVSMGLTGYMVTNLYAPGHDAPYGVKIQDFISAPIHLHAAHFKVDVDINGTSNRYETLDIEEETVFIDRPPNPEYSQTKYAYNLKSSEKNATYEYNFDKPMYHIFHNNNARNTFGEKKSFRLKAEGIAKQLMRRNVGYEKAAPWARHQLAVTRYKDQEYASSSFYRQWIPSKKNMDFQSFIDDDESIVDEDLVAWVTLGIHHIPHTEDLPVTTTPGKHATFHLLPYNYFSECPSMMSRDAVFMSHSAPEDPAKGLSFADYGSNDVSKLEQAGVCQYKPYDMVSYWLKQPDALLETTYSKGL